MYTSHIFLYFYVVPVTYVVLSLVERMWVVIGDLLSVVLKAVVEYLVLPESVPRLLPADLGVPLRFLCNCRDRLVRPNIMSITFFLNTNIMKT